MKTYIKSFINTGINQEPARNFEVFLPANISIITGYYTEDSSLIDVSTDVTITMIDAPSAQGWKVDPFNINYFYLYQLGSYTFEIVYTDGLGITFTYDLSVVVIQPTTLPSKENIYNLIKRS